MQALQVLTTRRKAFREMSVAKHGCRGLGPVKIVPCSNAISGSSSRALRDTRTVLIVARVPHVETATQILSWTQARRSYLHPTEMVQGPAEG